jgi:hypothetical protein
MSSTDTDYIDQVLNTWEWLKEHHNIDKDLIEEGKRILVEGKNAKD